MFILDLTPGFNGLGKDKCKLRWETSKFWDLVCIILEVWWYIWQTWCSWLSYLMVPSACHYSSGIFQKGSICHPNWNSQVQPIIADLWNRKNNCQDGANKLHQPKTNFWTISPLLKTFSQMNLKATTIYLSSQAIYVKLHQIWYSNTTFDVLFDFNQNNLSNEQLRCQ